MAPEKPQYLSWKALRWLHPNAAAWQGSSARCAHGSPCSEYAPEFTAKVKESESEVAQSCPTLCNPMDCSLPGSSVHGIFHASTGVGRHFLLQGVFPTQGSNQGLPHSRQTLSPLSHQGSQVPTKCLESAHYVVMKKFWSLLPYLFIFRKKEKSTRFLV